MLDVVFVAHGALGPWDEVIFVGVGIVFFGLMIWSWIQSRQLPETETPTNTETTPVDEDRFRLE
ncbi:MAG: hypothetical protein MUF87_19180 [Anaerolineae bacterium]|jgi:hypothetical protein|nr:hypothetical protein [Anaerolineae bacterium]